jgi:hypothetical protein
MPWIAKLKAIPFNRPFWIEGHYYAVRKKYEMSDNMIVATNNKGESETLTRRQAEMAFDERIYIDPNNIKGELEKLAKREEEEILKRILTGN